MKKIQLLRAKQTHEPSHVKRRGIWLNLILTLNLNKPLMTERMRMGITKLSYNLVVSFQDENYWKKIL